MGNAYSELLKRPTAQRTAADYEAVFDDFIRFAGGERLEDRLDIPPDVQNADYHLLADPYELLIELKQMHTYRKEASIGAYFNALLAQGRVKTTQPLVIGQTLEIKPESLSEADWRRFYLKFRPSVTTHLDKAAAQLKATRAFLPRADAAKPFYCGAVLLNSNDYNVSTDLLLRLAEWRCKDKWRRGLYSHIDFVACLSLDLVQSGRHLLHCRFLVRRIEDTVLVEACRRLFDRWIYYGGEGLGAEVSFEPGGEAADPIRVGAKVHGKIATRTTPVMSNV
jgi:hypothetical protein